MIGPQILIQESSVRHRVPMITCLSASDPLCISAMITTIYSRVPRAPLPLSCLRRLFTIFLRSMKPGLSGMGLDYLPFAWSGDMASIHSEFSTSAKYCLVVYRAFVHFMTLLIYGRS
jgi:hypothetical protein